MNFVNYDLNLASLRDTMIEKIQAGIGSEDILQTMLNFLGLFFLGVIITIVIEAITGNTWGLFLRQRFQPEKSLKKDFETHDDLLRFGDEALYIVEFVPDGWETNNITLKQGPEFRIEDTLASGNQVNLPDSIHSIVGAIEVERTRLETSAGGWWNGKTLAVDEIQIGRIGVHETPTLTITTSPSDHASSVVCSNIWQKRYDSGQINLPSNLVGINPGMIHDIGLNATLVTDDGKLILVKRSPHTDSGRSGWHISVGEGMQINDKNDTGAPDPYVGLVRGVREELGIQIDVSNIKFHTAMFDMRRYQFGLLVHIDLSGTGITAAEVVAARKLGLSKDRFENTEIEIIPWTFDDVVIKLKEQDWIAHGWINLLYSAISSFNPPVKEIHKLITDRR